MAKGHIFLEFVKKAEARKKLKGSIMVAKFVGWEFSFAANQPVFAVSR